MSKHNVVPLKSRHKGIYLLPNILTTSALCFGFLSIIWAIQGEMDSAAKCIFFALIADGLDGRVARLTHTQSEFGKHYDSLSDMVAFGIAPAILLFITLGGLGHLGWALAFSYAALTAIRLARFNVEDGSLGDFQGLPCPSAAALLAATIWLFNQTMLEPLLLAGLGLCLGGLMVSTIPYPSFKSFDLKSRYSKLWVLAMVGICAAVVINPPWVLWSIFMLFVCYGPVRQCAIRLGWMGA